MKDKIIDVGYQEINNDGTEKIPVFLSIGEVSQELNVATSTIRYWSNKYSHLLDTERCNTHRRYSKTDIEKLRLVRDLSDKNYTHDHIIHELENFKLDITSMSKSIEVSPENNPLQVQILAEALANQMAIKMKEQLQDEFNKLKNELVSNNEKYMNEIKSELCIAIDETIPNTLETHHKALQEDLKVRSENILQNQIKGITEHFEGIIKQQNNDIVERDIKITKQLQEVLTNRKEDILKKSMNHQESKGFFKRLFGK
ncbi:MAG: MerR family transcriptional regulator [Peptostreptococcaceae bacterium]